jgi:hypothetical protein
LGYHLYTRNYVIYKKSYIAVNIFKQLIHWLVHYLKKKLLLVAISLIFCLTLLPVFSSGQPTYTPQDYISILDTAHNININRYGQVIINDTFLIANNGSSATNYFVIGVHNNYKNNLFYLEALSNNIDLEVSDEFSINENITGYAIIFNDDLNPASVMNLSVAMVFGSIINPQSPGVYQVTVFRFPLVYYNITSLEASINVPGVLSSPSNPVYTATNISNYNFTEFNIAYTYASNPLIHYNEFKRDFILDPWTGLRVIETHDITILNKAGSTGASSITVKPLNNSINFKVYDQTGDINFQELETDDETELLVVFRYLLDQYYRYVFFVEYNPSPNTYIDTSTGMTALNITTLPPFWTVSDYSTNIILPSSSGFGEINVPDGFTLNQVNNNLIYITRANTTSFSNSNISIQYFFSILDIVGRPLIIAGLIFIALIIVIVYNLYLRREVEEVKVRVEKPIPKEEINEFTRLFENKIVISIRLDKLEIDAQKRKIKKIEYRKQKRIYLDNIKKIEKELMPLKEKIIEFGPRYADYIKNLELFDAEKDNSQKALEELKIRYRNRKITTATYLKLKEDLESKIDRASKNIDKTILSLKQEVM